MVVPVSKHPLEFTVLTPILSAPSGSPTKYIVEGESRTILDSNGIRHVLTKNSSWSPLPSPSGEAHVLYIVSSSIREGSRVYTNEIHVSNRALQPNRWRTYCHDDSQEEPIYDKFWLRRGGGDPYDPLTGEGTSQTGVGPPVGGATDLNERWWERWNLAPGEVSNPETMQFHHNPTFGGTGDRPTLVSLGGAIDDYGVSAKAYTPKPYIFFTQSRESSSLPAKIVGGGSPLDFGGDPGNYEYSDHGYGTNFESEDRPAWWWRMRMWRTFYPSYKEMPRITRVDNGSYFPVNWVSSVNYPLLVQFVENWDLVPSAFSECYFLNVSSGAMTRLPNVYTTGTFVTGTGYPADVFTAPYTWASNHGIMRHRITQRYDVTQQNPTGQPLRVVPGMPAYNSPYLGLVYRDPTTGFSFAVATTVEPCTNTDEDSRNDLKHPCSLQAWHRMATKTRPYTELANEGDIAYVVHKSRVERGQGWLFHKTFVFVGEFSSVSGDYRSLFQAGEFDSPLTVADVPQEILNSIVGESYRLATPLDRGQLHPFVAVVHTMNERAKLLQASAYYDLNLSSYSLESNYKNLLQSYANSATEASGWFPNSMEDYFKFRFGRDFHKLYYDYTHNFNRHRAISITTTLNGPTIFGHTFGSILTNSKFNQNGTFTSQYPQYIVSSLDNVFNFKVGSDGIFNSSSTASGTYVASSLNDVYVKSYDLRNSGILSYVDFSQTSGSSPQNYFTVLRLNKSDKRGARYNPIFHENTVIKQKSVDNLSRIIFDISKYPHASSVGYDVSNNFLTPNHKFKLKFKTMILDEAGRTLGGDSVGVWIHTKPEDGKIWTYTKDNVWVQHSANNIEISDVVDTYSHIFGFRETPRDLDPDKLRCARFLVPSNPNRANDLLASLEESEFNTVELTFNTDNLPISVPTDYFKSVGTQVHRLNQNYVIEIFSNCKNPNKFTLFYDLDLIDQTLNTWSKPLIAGIPNGSNMGEIYCKEYRVDVSRDELLTIIRYFNDIAGAYSNFGYANRSASYTSGVYETSGGSRINYVESPYWNTYTVTGTGLITNLTFNN